MLSGQEQRFFSKQHCNFPETDAGAGQGAVRPPVIQRLPCSVRQTFGWSAQNSRIWASQIVSIARPFFVQRRENIPGNNGAAQGLQTF